MTIILKRNNTPTKPGNYFCAAIIGEAVPVVVYKSCIREELLVSSEDFHGCHLYTFAWWSDELGPIQFEEEAMPEKPPGLRGTYLRWKELPAAIQRDVVGNFLGGMEMLEGGFTDSKSRPDYPHALFALDEFEKAIDRYEDTQLVEKSEMQEKPSCPRCYGKGNVRERSDPDNAAFGTYQCPRCNGTGKESLQVPPRLRQGWFEYAKRTYRVVDFNEKEYLVSPSFRNSPFLRKVDAEAIRLDIHWHDEPAEGMRSVEATLLREQVMLPKSNNFLDNVFVIRGEDGHNIDFENGTKVTITYPAPPPAAPVVEIAARQRWQLLLSGTRTVQQNGKWWQIVSPRNQVTSIGTGENENTTACYEKEFLTAWLNEHATLVPEGE